MRWKLGSSAAATAERLMSRMRRVQELECNAKLSDHFSDYFSRIEACTCCFVLQTLQGHKDAREACASQCRPTDHNCILCLMWYLSILKCVFFYMLRNLWHRTAPLTLICMLSVKVKSSHDAHFSFPINSECLDFISFIEVYLYS